MSTKNWYEDSEVVNRVSAMLDNHRSRSDIQGYLLQQNYRVSLDILNEQFASRGMKGSHKPHATASDDNTEEVEITPEKSVEEAVKRERDLLKLRAEQRVLAEMTRAEARKRNWLAALTEASAALPPPEPWKPSVIYHDNSKHEPHSVMLMLSDMHAGKWVDPKLVGDRFSFDKFILEDEVQRWKNTVHKITDIHRAAYAVNDLYLFAMGDLVEGSDMRASQKLRIDHSIGTVGRQTVYTGRLLAEILRDFAGSFRTVYFVGVAGNHGRIGKWGDNENVDNCDFLSYHFAQLHCKDISNVKFYIPDTPSCIVKIGDKTYKIQHGDAVRSWGESIAGAVKRAARKDAFVDDLITDYWLAGHFHQQYSFQAGGRMKIIMGGHWDGGDHYCVQVLKEACEPSQGMFLLHPSRGIVAQYDIALREDNRAPASVFDLTVLNK